jgi:hypothetical protein
VPPIFYTTASHVSESQYILQSCFLTRLILGNENLVYRRNLVNTILLFILTVVTITILYEFVWYKGLNLWILQTRQESIVSNIPSSLILLKCSVNPSNLNHLITAIVSVSRNVHYPRHCTLPSKLTRRPAMDMLHRSARLKRPDVQFHDRRRST